MNTMPIILVAAVAHNDDQHTNESSGGGDRSTVDDHRRNNILSTPHYTTLHHIKIRLKFDTSRWFFFFMSWRSKYDIKGIFWFRTLIRNLSLSVRPPLSLLVCVINPHWLPFFLHEKFSHAPSLFTCTDRLIASCLLCYSSCSIATLCSQSSALQLPGVWRHPYLYLTNYLSD